MASKAIATLSQVSTKSKTDYNFLNRADRAAIQAYVSAGITARSTDIFILDLIEANPGRSVQEYITLLDKNADRSVRSMLCTRINKILRTTGAGRALTTAGLVALIPGAAPYWFYDVRNVVGAVKARMIVPRRDPAVQRPTLRFSKEIPAAMRNEARAVLNSFLDIGGIGTRWRAHEVIQAAESDVRATLAALAREHALGVALANTATPMITNLVESAVRELVGRASPTLTATSPTANQIAM